MRQGCRMNAEPGTVLGGRHSPGTERSLEAVVNPTGWAWIWPTKKRPASGGPKVRKRRPGVVSAYGAGDWGPEPQKVRRVASSPTN
jgi:hypothetical protein